MKYFSMDELKTLLRATPEDKPWQRLMFLVAYWHGLRVSELVGPKGLKGKHIQHGYIKIERLKGSDKVDARFVKHRDPELDEHGPLTELAARFKGDEPLFPITDRGVRKLMERISKKTDLNRMKMHPHALKHTTAMHAIRGGITIDKVKSMLGHKSLSSTGFYLEADQDEALDEFAKAMGA